MKSEIVSLYFGSNLHSSSLEWITELKHFFQNILKMLKRFSGFKKEECLYVLLAKEGN